MDVKISVILPVYKVEDYLPKAIESMMNQTLREIEIIIVDDGSPDKCPVIADEYALKDERIRVIHKENGGAPSARNAGIEIASGKYLYFLDPDDWAEENMLEIFYELCEKNNANLLIAGFINEYYESGKEFSIPVEVEAAFYENKQEFRENAHRYLDNTLLAVPWNKLYKNSYIKEHGLLFPTIAWDDLHFNMEVMMDIDRVYICDGAFYHFFRSRAGSETTKVFDGRLYEKRKEQFRHILKLYKYWNIKSRDISSQVYAYYVGRLVQCIQEICGCKNLELNEKKSLIKDILEDKLTKKALRIEKHKSRLMRVCIFCMKLGNIYLCMVMGYGISFIKNKCSRIFMQLKAKTQGHD